MSLNESSKTSRRRFLFMLGVGAGTLVAADTLFAKQFAREAATAKLPAMVYDPALQVMVDPETRQPLYVRAEMVDAEDTTEDQDKEDKNNKAKQDKKTDDKKAGAKAKKTKAQALPSVTAGCSNCPKCDDHCG